MRPDDPSTKVPVRGPGRAYWWLSTALMGPAYLVFVGWATNFALDKAAERASVGVSTGLVLVTLQLVGVARLPGLRAMPPRRRNRHLAGSVALATVTAALLAALLLALFFALVLAVCHGSDGHCLS